jgi:hypothetical protein
MLVSAKDLPAAVVLATGHQLSEYGQKCISLILEKIDLSQTFHRPTRTRATTSPECIASMFLRLQDILKLGRLF